MVVHGFGVGQNLATGAEHGNGFRCRDEVRTGVVSLADQGADGFHRRRGVANGSGLDTGDGERLGHREAPKLRLSELR